MRKAVFIVFIALGAAVGLLATHEDGWGLSLVMAAFGALMGSAVGGALLRIGKSGQPLAIKESLSGFLCARHSMTQRST